MSNEFLKKNPVFWSRLGFCYDPPLKNSEGKPLVFTENFDAQLATHREFMAAGVKKTRYTLAGALTATAAGVAVSTILGGRI